MIKKYCLYEWKERPHCKHRVAWERDGLTDDGGAQTRTFVFECECEGDGCKYEEVKV